MILFILGWITHYEDIVDAITIMKLPFYQAHEYSPSHRLDQLPTKISQN